MASLRPFLKKVGLSVSRALGTAKMVGERPVPTWIWTIELVERLGDGLNRYVYMGERMGLKRTTGVW
jgi:hypothetical protein